MHEEHLWQVEAQLDYLAPFLAQLPPGEKLTRWQAVRLKDECLSDFKQRLIDKANLIQARFEKVQPGPWQGRGPQHPQPENGPRAVCSPSQTCEGLIGERGGCQCLGCPNDRVVLPHTCSLGGRVDGEGVVGGWMELYNSS